MKKILSFIFRTGFLLGLSAILSKGLSFWRNRLLVETFPPEQTDLIFAAFRVPDFFFALFVGATLSVIFIPQINQLKTKTEKTLYLSSFFWGVVVWFGGLVTLGILTISPLVNITAMGLDTDLKIATMELARWLFVSIFMLGISGVFSAYLQAKGRFMALALAPIFYMGSICGALFFFRDQFGINIVAYGALLGSFLHLLLNAFYFFFYRGAIRFAWKKPLKAWQEFHGDFWRRVFNNSVFQINQTVDLWVASFLISGAITAFSIGTNFGHLLLSIVGYSIANAAFPKLSKTKNDAQKQQAIVKSSIKWILLFTVPFAIISAVGSTFWLSWLFALKGTTLSMAASVFFWTVISLPFACMIPILSRVFLANNDTKTPLLVGLISIVLATTLVLVLTFLVLPKETQILGLAYGNFTANVLSAGLFTYFLSKKWKTPLSSNKPKPEKELMS